MKVDHNFLPDKSFNINLRTHYEIVDIPQGEKEILFPTLAPNEQIEISYLYPAPETHKDITTYVKSFAST